MSTLDILQHFERCRAALEAGQAQVEALLASIRERVAVEEAYNKSLTRLTRSTMGVDGACRAAGRRRGCARAPAERRPAAPAGRPAAPSPPRWLTLPPARPPARPPAAPLPPQSA